MMYKIVCNVCGGTFYSPRKDAKYCSETCRRKPRGPTKKEKQKKICLAEINEKARTAGLSYGKYKALEYIEKNHI